MKSNVVLTERTLRVGLGMLLLASPLLELHTFPLNLLGIVLLATGAVGYCPLYGLLAAPKRKIPPALKLMPRPEVCHETVQAHPRTR